MYEVSVGRVGIHEVDNGFRVGFCRISGLFWFPVSGFICRISGSSKHKIVDIVSNGNTFFKPKNLRRLKERKGELEKDTEEKEKEKI